jgi:hypothetical protein
VDNHLPVIYCWQTGKDPTGTKKPYNGATALLYRRHIIGEQIDIAVVAVVVAARHNFKVE